MSKVIVKIKQIAIKLDKSITDIAQETGLNRNTITALYHGKVDGIKFETITKFCDVYNLKLEDVLELVHESPVAHDSTNVYKQEGEVIPFTGWAFGLQVADMNKRFFKNDYGVAYGYWKGPYMEAFWSIDNVNALAAEVYERFQRPQDVDAFFLEYLKTAKVFEDYYMAHDEQSFNGLSERQMLDFFDKIRAAYTDFWGISLFIDAFDSGFDQKKIGEIAKRYGLSLDEVGLLTTPFEMTFNNDRQLELFELVAAFKKQKKHKDALSFVNNSPEAISYRKKFGYYKSNYCYVKSISAEEQAQEIENWLADEANFKKQFRELKNYSQTRQEKINELLKRKKLKENPLYFFQKLTYWREHRKKANLMGIHLLFGILGYLEKSTGIKLEYLKFINFDEVESVLRGSITQEILKNRYENGMFATFNADGYKIVTGKEAESLRNQLSEETGHGQDMILTGQVASQGYARGLARVVLSQSDFGKFKEGEILVTSMTRPEYLPIMKLAAAFVTNEGGITCHAAIVAREMGKPCIIGTKNATQVIKDGDLIEVRANHGTVRILNEAA